MGSPKPPDEDEKASKDKLFKTTIRLFFKGFIELVDAELAATLDLEDPAGVENRAAARGLR